MDKTLAQENQHTFTRDVRVDVPNQYVDGTAAPFMVVQDGDGYVDDVQNSLENLIAAKKVPIMLAVFVNNGGGDGQDSERGLEYDTMSDRYSKFVDTNVLPAAQNAPAIKADYPTRSSRSDQIAGQRFGRSNQSGQWPLAVVGVAEGPHLDVERVEQADEEIAVRGSAALQPTTRREPSAVSRSLRRP